MADPAKPGKPGAGSPRGASGGRTTGPARPDHARDHADEDAIDRAAAEEVQDAPPGPSTPEGAAFPKPGGGAVVAPGGARAPQEPTGGDPAGEGAGDALRGGAGGPLPPGTGRPLPKPDEPDERSERVRAERVEGPGEGAGIFAADGPTAHEAGIDGPRPADRNTAAMEALGVEAGRNGWVLWVMGIAAILAGLVALAMPLMATFAATIFVAAMLVASGAVGLFTSFRRRDGGAIAAGFALSALAIVTGVVMLVAPLAGIVALSTLIVAWFAASGALKLWYGIKADGMTGRGWMIASGVLSLGLAVLLWFSLPGAALWLPGLLLAVDLILYGTLLIALALFGRPKLAAAPMR